MNEDSSLPQMLCLVYEPMLPLLVGNELDSEDAQAVQAHAAGCAWCRRRLHEYEHLNTALQTSLGLDYSAEPFALDMEEALMQPLDSANESPASQAAGMPALRSAEPAENPPTAVSPTHLRRGLSALGAVAAVVLLSLLGFYLFGGRATTPPISPPAPTPTPVTAALVPPGIYQFTAPPALPPAVAPHNAVVAPDGSLWYVTSSAAVNALLVHVGVTGTVVTYRVPGPDEAAMYVDSEGNVVGDWGPGNSSWFLDVASGAVKNLPGALCLSGTGCTPGPDGYFWEYYAPPPSSTQPALDYTGTIARINPETNQIVSQTPVPAALRSQLTGENLVSFRVAPDGVAWFVYYQSQHIWLASFDLQTGHYRAVEIATPTPDPLLPPYGGIISSLAAPDGGLWLWFPAYLGNTDVITDVIYHASQDGQLTGFPNPKNWLSDFSEYEVVDEHSNLCAYTGGQLDAQGPQGPFLPITYQCMSPQGTVRTLGSLPFAQVNQAGAFVGDSLMYPVSNHSVWFLGTGAHVVLISFPQ